MHDLPTRIHRLKLILASLLLTMFGAALITVENTSTSGWLRFVPWGELGGIIVGVGIISI